MDESICKGCGQAKPQEGFYRSNRNKCKECVKEAVQGNYRRNIKHYREYERERFKRPDRKAKCLEYQRWRRAKHPQKNSARHAVSNAIRDGKLIRLPCQVCGNPESEAHHTDYSKPLDVQWLCFKHHREAHGQQVAA